MVDQLVLHRKATWAQLVLHSTSAVLLTLLTGFLGAPFLRVIRQSQGAWKFWLAGLFFVVGFWSLGTIIVATFIGSVWVTIGLYSELERRGYGWWTSGLVGTLVGFLVGVAGCAAVLQQQGVKNWEGFVGAIHDSLEVVQQISPEMKLDSSLIASQTPSILVILLLLSLGTALAFEEKTFRVDRACARTSGLAHPTFRVSSPGFSNLGCSDGIAFGDGGFLVRSPCRCLE